VLDDPGEVLQLVAVDIDRHHREGALACKLLQLNSEGHAVHDGSVIAGVR
jgi:hypothetical protein